jgi:hypothetical protein
VPTLDFTSSRGDFGIVDYGRDFGQRSSPVTPGPTGSRRRLRISEESFCPSPALTIVGTNVLRSMFWIRLPPLNEEQLLHVRIGELRDCLSSIETEGAGRKAEKAAR